MANVHLLCDVRPGKINDYKKILNAKTGFRAKYIFEANNFINIKNLNSLRTRPYKYAKDEYRKIAEEELKGLAQEAMADDYLFKPFTADQLTVKVLNILP